MKQKKLRKNTDFFTMKCRALKQCDQTIQQWHGISAVHRQSVSVTNQSIGD